MFVRWQRRRKRAGWFWERGEPRWVFHWAASLDESKRVNGKLRQTHIAYLGGFTRARLKSAPHQRMYFWEGVESRLDRLGNRISPDDRRRIVAAIAAKAGEPP